MSLFLGIDVGTGSARAGVFDRTGRLLGHDAKGIETYRPAPDFVQQSSAEIWSAVCAAIRGALDNAGTDPAQIIGMGFDATCSLAVAGANGTPVTISPNGEPDQDVILWMDHRAMDDAYEINALGGAPLEYVGGEISPEMQLPKLRWLKRELPQSWAAVERFWDLPDWLVHRATGGETRSLCSTVCKWTYLGHKGQAGEGWDDAFLAKIGLAELSENDHAAIGHTLAPPGTNCGGLSETAAKELGLLPGTAVAASMIDAHAGALGTLGMELGDDNITQRLAMIAGTSTCHIGLTRDPVFVPGVWGPYYGVVLPDAWALEGGQSAAGALLDAVIARHGATAELTAQAKSRGKRITDLLEALLAAKGDDISQLAAHRHIQPDFHGNRSPLAQPWRHGGIDGLTLDTGPDDLALDYLATVQGLAYGTRQIMEAMTAAGASFDTLVLSGGLAKNKLYLQEHADATGCTLLVPHQAEPVLAGSAMLGAVAAGAFDTLPAAMAAMSGTGTTITPRGSKAADFHNRKYRVFQKMQADHAAYRDIMNEKDTTQ
ncbi:FGGY-family carbohydrate kinase [Primorskyibacter marinus]|uniref:FGGY-family carbohydrate kinase n=1 Tax=Primorskyibacter marinus TaxID=1977320 RepID=UPI000E3073A6|nr:FGGY-family carbohydrate kinase [Primorskyibacter marinus]